jgi:hypothetical protein
MNVSELKEAYSKLSKEDQLLFASIIAADQMIKDPAYAVRVSEAHRRLEEGEKLTHEQVKRQHEELEAQGL